MIRNVKRLFSLYYDAKNRCGRRMGKLILKWKKMKPLASFTHRDFQFFYKNHASIHIAVIQ